MFVLNDCRTDARVLREAATLTAGGYAVTIVARTVEPYAARGDVERADGFEIRRAPVGSGWLRWALLARSPGRLGREARSWAVEALRAGPLGWARALATVAVLILLAPLLAGVGVAGLLVLGVMPRVGVLGPAWRRIEWALQWRLGTLPWAREAVRAAPSGDVFHAHDLRALPAATAAADRDGGVVVYDSHEVFVEADAHARRSTATRAAMRRLERRMASPARALVTVNEDLAALLGPALGFEGRTVVVRNTRPRWTPPDPDPHRLRAAAGVPVGMPVVLSHGLFAVDRGFEELAAALALPALAGVHGVFLGRGPMRARLDELAASPALAGRLHVVDAVPPGDLLEWICDADVNAVVIQPTTLNHRLSTPNKLFESLAAGVPVVASDFAPMRRIVIDDPDGPLGRMCDPTDPASIAAAIRALLDLAPADAAALRRRCLAAAHARYAWEVDGGRLVELYAGLGARHADPAMPS